MILEEFDNNRRAIINPEDLIEALPGFPETVVSCFAHATFERMLADFQHDLLTSTSMANIEILIYKVHRLLYLMHRLVHQLVSLFWKI